jgi:putative ABC transport system substrate-binding protein
MNAANPNRPGWLKAFDVISPKLGIEVVRPNLTDAAQIEPLISAFGGEPNGGVLVLPDPFFRGDFSLLGQLLVKYRLPSIAGLNAFAESGGLIAYSIDQMDLARRAAFYVNRILKGELPRNLPVQGPTQFELLINMKTARSLSLTLPQSLFVSVNRVIE